MYIALDYLDSLYSCQNDVYTMDPIPQTNTLPEQPTALRVAKSTLPTGLWHPSRYTPVSKSKQLKSELWLLQLGSPGISQLNVLPGNMTGLPAEFDYHPFCFINFKAQA
jgi:hypothetical protein